MDGQPAPCEFQLVAKDGVYMVQIPRKVDHIVMAAANRWGASSAVNMFRGQILQSLKLQQTLLQ